MHIPTPGSVTLPRSGFLAPPPPGGDLVGGATTAIVVVVGRSIEQADAAFAALVGRPLASLVGQEWAPLLGPDLVRRWARAASQPGADPAVVEFECALLLRPDEGPWVAVQAVRTGIGERGPCHVLHITDLTHWRRALQAATATERRGRTMRLDARDTVTLLDDNCRALASTAFDVGALGYTSEEARRIEPRDLVHPDDRGAMRSLWRSACSAGGRPVDGSLRVRAADGHWAEVAVTVADRRSDPLVGAVVVATREIVVPGTRRRAGPRDRDELTGLLGRRALLRQLEAVLARPVPRRRAALLFCDLDRFKVVNDSLGHRVGDALLSAVAERFRSAFPTRAAIARLGGDEIIVLLEGVDGLEPAREAAHRLTAALDDPFALAGHELRVSASVGIAFPSDHVDPDAWLHDADAAMYRAKRRGRNRVEVFDGAMRAEARARLALQSDLWRAVDRDELVVNHQPVVDIETWKVVAVEALVRWDSPDHGLLGPDSFIPLAEETGAIAAIGAHVLERATADLAEVASVTGRHDLRLGVNLSTRQIGRDLPGLVAHTCRASGWPADQLVLEVTETAVTDEVSGTLGVLDEVRRLGVGLALDDFGTGHSSLTRLGQMPVGQVKIDRSFVGAIGGPDAQLARMVDAVVGVGRALDLDVVAEGVETDEQAAYLLRLGCRRAQGFLYSPAVAVADLVDLVAPPR